MIPLQLKPAPDISISQLNTPRFQLFDLVVASDFPFKNRFPSATTEPDLRFGCQLEPPVPIEWEQVKPLYASQEKTGDEISLFSFYSAENCILVRFSDYADFYLWSDAIVCHLLNPAYAFMVEICFLGMVMACWFELQGILALHAAATVINGQAVAFLSSNKGGKSSLAAAFTQQGYPMLTDDILLIEMLERQAVGRSGYPQMRMWPEQAALLFGDAEEFSPVHPYLDKRWIPLDFEKPGMFESGRFPLVRCYIPKRYTPENNKSEISITPVSPIEAVLTLAGYSFLFWLVEKLGLQPGRLTALSQVVQTASVRQLAYPDGLDYLPAVCQAVLDDLDSLPLTIQKA